MILPDWVKQFKTKGIEIRKRGERFHAYKVTSKWNPEKKRAQKITLDYLGIITPNGINKPRKQGVLKGDYEYGHISLLWQLSNESGLLPLLKEHYPYKWKEILSFIFLRLIQPLPLKSIQHLYSKTFLSTLFPKTSMSPKSLSDLLQYAGDFPSRNNLMKKMVNQGKYIIIDLTALFSYSENITLLEKGYNKDHLKLPQINMLLLFSSDQKLPTYVRLLPGSIRDVTTIKNTVKMAGVKNYFFIADRGFYSDQNIKMLGKEDISYIVPLKRNNTIIPKIIDEKFEGVFVYNDRPIIFWKRKVENNFLYIYEDKLLKQEEETNYLLKLEQGKKKPEDYYQEKIKFGLMYILSDVDYDPDIIYNLYKDREQIEYAFNVFKNLLESDKSYLRDNSKFEGYIFFNFLSLHLYYLILNRLRKAELNKKYSVSDIILQFSKVKMYDFEGGDMMSEIPKKVRELAQKLEVNLNLLRINRES